MKDLLRLKYIGRKYKLINIDNIFELLLKKGVEVIVLYFLRNVIFVSYLIIFFGLDWKWFIFCGNE